MSSENIHGLSSSGTATLWAHLLRDDRNRAGSTGPPPLALPPLAPQDKNATTMRVLLHDTQMNLERFSGHVETLISGVNESRQEIRATSMLFEQEHDKLVGDMIDLGSISSAIFGLDPALNFLTVMAVNRSQTQIQNTLGSPAQSTVLDAFIGKVELRLESLDQRLDAMQAFNQTHSQALQTQIQAIQNMQTQQNVILAAITPLLPLLQSLIPKLDSVSSTNLSQTQRTETTSQTMVEKRPSLHANKAEEPRKRQRSISRGSIQLEGNLSIQSASLSNKKPRLQPKSPAQHTPSELHRRLFPSSSPEPIRYSTDSEGHSSKPPTRGLPHSTPRRPLQELLPQKMTLQRGATPSASRYLAGMSSIPATIASVGEKPKVKHPHAHHDMQQTPRQASSKFLPSPFRFVQDTSQTTVKPCSVNGSSQKQIAMLPPPTIPTPRVPMVATIQATPNFQSTPFLRANSVRRPSFQSRLKEPVKEGKRFIPLVDTDDEEDSE